MQAVTTISFDIAKSVFQVHGVPITLRNVRDIGTCPKDACY